MYLAKYALLMLMAFSPMCSYARGLSFADEEKHIGRVNEDHFGAHVIRLKVWEPHEEQDALYEGYPVKEVLSKIFGQKWEKADVIYFICKDGYRSPVPREKVEKVLSLLAVRRYDLSGNSLKFTVDNKGQNEKNVSLEPFYLVWDNKSDSKLKEEGALHWPYQVVKIELWKNSDLLAKITPPSESSERLKNGFSAFQKNCMSCHSVNGVGGTKGGDLTSSGVLGTMDNGQLKAWIDNPVAINPKTTMPPLDSNLQNRDKTIDDIITYLRSFSLPGHASL